MTEIDAYPDTATPCLSGSWGYMRLSAALSVGIIGLAGTSILRPSEKVNFSLFKYASFYMMGSMLMIVFGKL